MLDNYLNHLFQYIHHIRHQKESARDFPRVGFCIQIINKIILKLSFVNENLIKIKVFDVYIIRLITFDIEFS